VIAISGVLICASIRLEHVHPRKSILLARPRARGSAHPTSRSSNVVHSR
jgi:hypothetical protein